MVNVGNDAKVSNVIHQSKSKYNPINPHNS